MSPLEMYEEMIVARDKYREELEKNINKSYELLDQSVSFEERNEWEVKRLEFERPLEEDFNKKSEKLRKLLSEGAIVIGYRVLVCVNNEIELQPIQSI